MRWWDGWDGLGEWGGIRKFVREERAGVVGEGARAPGVPCMLATTQGRVKNVQFRFAFFLLATSCGGLRNEQQSVN